MLSCLYTGSISHRRVTPRAHAFRYRIFMTMIDLSELPGLFDRFLLWSARRPALAWFRRADYHGDVAVPRDQSVRGAATRLLWNGETFDAEFAPLEPGTYRLRVRYGPKDVIYERRLDVRLRP